MAIDASSLATVSSTTRYVPNPAFEDAYLRSTDIRDLLLEVMDVAEANALQLVPHRLGILEDSIGSEVEVDAARGSLVGRLFATDWKAPLWEFGTVRGEHPFLRPALEAAAPGASWSGGKA